MKFVDILHNLIQEYRNLVLYFFIGISAASVDFLLFAFLFNVLDIRAVIATVFSIGVATIFGFTLNMIYNFKLKDNILFRFVLYSLVSGVGVMISIGIIYVLHSLYGFNGNIVKLATLPPIFLTQYLLNTFISFRRIISSDQL